MKTYSHIMRRSLSLVYLYCLSCLSCTETEVSQDFQEIKFETLVTNIYGGFFLSNSVSSNSSLAIDVMPNSVNTHIDTYIEGCTALNVTFNLRRNSARLNLKLRAYLENPQDPLLRQGLTEESVQVDGRTYTPISGPIVRPLNRTIVDEQLDSPSEASWTLHLNQGTSRFQISTENHSDDPPSVNVCTLTKSALNKRLLIRQQLTYQFTDHFNLALFSLDMTAVQLASALSHLENHEVDGVVVFHRIEDVPNLSQQLNEVRTHLNRSSLMWWVLPFKDEKSDKYLALWRTLFAKENYAVDFGKVRLMFLDTTNLHLSQFQLALIERWISSKSISPNALDQIHTRALISHSPLINPLSGIELSYRPGALRTLSDLRKAHTTHQVVTQQSFTTSPPVQLDQLGTNMLVVPPLEQNKALLLRIRPDCSRDQKGEQCFTREIISLDLEFN